MKDVKFGLQKDAIFTRLFISILQQTPTGASWWLVPAQMRGSGASG